MVFIIFSLLAFLKASFLYAGPGDFAVGLIDQPRRSSHPYIRSPDFNDPEFTLYESASLEALSVLTEGEASSLFAELRSSRIPFRYALDGCYARAHAMAYLAEQRGVVMGKVFAVGRFQALSDSWVFYRARWDWHVAPVVWVESEQGREIRVFDPALAGRPLSLSEWVALMSTSFKLTKSERVHLEVVPRVDFLFFAERFQYYPDIKSPGRWTEASLRDVKTVFIDLFDQLKQEGL